MYEIEVSVKVRLLLDARLGSVQARRMHDINRVVYLHSGESLRHTTSKVISLTGRLACVRRGVRSATSKKCTLGAVARRRVKSSVVMFGEKVEGSAMPSLYIDRLCAGELGQITCVGFNHSCLLKNLKFALATDLHLPACDLGRKKQRTVTELFYFPLDRRNALCDLNFHCNEKRQKLRSDVVFRPNFLTYEEKAGATGDRTNECAWGPGRPMMVDYLVGHAQWGLRGRPHLQEMLGEAHGGVACRTGSRGAASEPPTDISLPNIGLCGSPSDQATADAQSYERCCNARHSSF